MDAFIAAPIAIAAGVGITSLVMLARSSNPGRVRKLLGPRAENVSDEDLSHAARGASRAIAAVAIGLLFLFVRVMPVVSDALFRAPIAIAIAGLVLTAAAGIVFTYSMIAWLRTAILRRLPTP